MRRLPSANASQQRPARDGACHAAKHRIVIVDKRGEGIVRETARLGLNLGSKLLRIPASL
jgi:hypothetical protein